MEVGRIEALLTARFDSDPFDRYDRAINGAQQEARKKITADLDADPDLAGFDKYGRELDQAQREAKKGATAKLDTRADTSGVTSYKRSLDDADRAQGRTEKSAGGLKGAWAGLAANAKFLLGGAAVGGAAIAFKTMYDEQSEAQEVSAQLNAVLKSTGGIANVTADDVDKLSNSIAEKAALDDETVASGAALLLTFKNIRNEAGEGNNIFDQTVKTTADVARAFGKEMPQAAIMMGKALNDPVAGISALSRVGIQFSEDQKDTIKSLVEGGDTMKAQKMILRELNDQVGGSAEAYGKTLPGAVDRTRNAFNNLMESLGGKLAPAVSAVADALTSLMEGDFKELGKLLAPIAAAVSTLWNGIKPVLEEIGSSFSEVFGGKEGRQMAKDLQAIGKVVKGVMDFMVAVMKRTAPAIGQIFRGAFLVIRGVVRLVGALLRGDWGAMWQAAKDLVKGALLGVVGVVRAQTAPIREVASRIWAPLSDFFRNAWNRAKDIVRDALAAVVDAVRARVSGARTAASNLARGVVTAFNVIRDIPGKIRSVLSSAVSTVRGFAGAMLSAGASMGTALMNGIMNGISAASGFVADIGSSIASWINDNTIFGDSVPVGPVTLHIPALAQGGKVGPSLRGAQFFVAGEGNLDEWVISQEGDRQKNIGWAVEALESLTGRKVEFNRRGRRGPDPFDRRKARRTEKAMNKAMKKVPAGWQGYLNSQTDRISRLEREYGQMDRDFNFTEEEFLVEHEDGSITLDQGAVDQRLSELSQLRSMRQKIIDAVNELIVWIKKQRRPIERAIRAMKKAAGAAGNAMNPTKRSRFTSQANTWQSGLNALLGAIPDLELDNKDNALDLKELDLERDAVLAMSGQVKGPDTDSPTGEPTAEQIAQGVAEQMALFNQQRADLFAGFGQNFIGAGGAITDLSAAAGFRYFGGGQSDGDLGVLGAAGGAAGPGAGVLGGAGAGAGGAGGGVSIVNNYAAPPPDPHTWSQNLAWEVRTVVN